ncbi:hypothetical protein [Rhodococcus opacus]|uniref:hypothetical protein n=1 Tax=Rhodococcus opacus TaxID=37919 RepID=UPI000AA56DD0|nr:hypothetical protein [Rhodococcus opacus]
MTAVRRIDDAAVEGRADPNSIRKVYNFNGVIGAESVAPFQESVAQRIDQLSPRYPTSG